MVVHWQKVPDGAGMMAEGLYRSDFDMTQEEADAFTEWMKSASPTSTYTLDGMRFRRDQVSRARYHDRSRFPADVIEHSQKVYEAGRKYVGEMLTVQ